jgi:hypothetical protein
LFQEINLRGYTGSFSHLQRLLDSVRRHHAGLHSFLSMSRMEAMRKNASAFPLRHSQSLANLRHRPSQENVRSTTHRLGKTSKLFAVSERLTISVTRSGKAFFRASQKTGP